MKKKALLCIVFGLMMAAGVIVVMIPAWMDRGEHWAMFVSRLPYFIPGMALLAGAAVGLTVLDKK